MAKNKILSYNKILIEPIHCFTILLFQVYNEIQYDLYIFQNNYNTSNKNNNIITTIIMTSSSL